MNTAIRRHAHERSFTRGLPAVWATLGLAGLLLLLAAPRAHALDLVSAQEAALPDDLTRGVTRAATIVQEQPPAKSGPIRSPFKLQIALKPHGGARIDVKSVQLIYMKTPLVDLTPRLQAGISERGIQMDDVALPPGRHNIQVRATDSEGRDSVALLELDVAR